MGGTGLEISSVNGYAKFDGVDGESRVAGRAHWIDIGGIGWAVSYPGHPSLDGIGISAAEGREYPALTLAQYTGRKFAHANIELVDGQGRIVLTMALANVIITGTAVGHTDSAARALVQYGLLAEGVTWTYFGVDHNGVLRPGYTLSLDVVHGTVEGPDPDLPGEYTDEWDADPANAPVHSFGQDGHDRTVSFSRRYDVTTFVEMNALLRGFAAPLKFVDADILNDGIVPRSTLELENARFTSLTISPPSVEGGHITTDRIRWTQTSYTDQGAQVGSPARAGWDFVANAPF